MGAGWCWRVESKGKKGERETGATIHKNKFQINRKRIIDLTAPIKLFVG